MNLEFRRARPDDAPTLQPLLHAAHRWNAAAGFNFTAATVEVDRIEERVAADEVYLMLEDGRLAGTVTVDDEGGIGWLGVAPEDQGKGYGRRLLAFAEDLLRQKGYARAKLDTPTNHPWLPAYYQRLGYVPVGTTHYEGKRYDSVLLEKSLLRSEHDKLLAGELYDTLDPELTAMRKRARRLTREYNESTEEESERRAALLKELLGSVGEMVGIEPPFRCDYGSHIRIGAGTFINFDCVILDCSPVEIGEHVLIGPRVQIYAATHPLDAAERIKGPMMGRPVRIGDNVWIGGGSIICPGVTIGENSTVAAGSVVIHDIPAGVLAGGNPCRVIRELLGGTGSLSSPSPSSSS